MKKIIVVASITSFIIALAILSLVFFNTALDRFTYDEFGRGKNIKIHVQDGNVTLLIYERGKAVYTQNAIYYYMTTTEYFYALTKWDDHIVIDIKYNKVIINSDDINEIPEEHVIIFSNRELFVNMTDYNYNVGYIVPFGDGTVYLDIMPHGVYLLSQKTGDGSSYKKMVSQQVKKYKLGTDHLYLILVDDSYVVVDYNNYVVMNECKELNELPIKYQEVFENGEFNNAQEILSFS